MGIKVGHGVQPPKCHAVHVTSSRAPFNTRYIGSVCSDQTGLGFEPVWRTTRLLTLNRKRFDHLLYTKLKPVYQTDQTTLGCGLFGRVCPNICSFEIKMAATEVSHDIHCTKINCYHRGSFLCYLD